MEPEIDNELQLAIYQAAADHLKADFDNTRALPLYFAGQQHLLNHVDVQQIEAIAKAVCAVVIPVCQAIEAI